MKFLFDKEISRFILTGIGSNVINFLVYVFVHALGASLFVSSLAGYGVGLFFSYHFGRIWVFGEKHKAGVKNISLFLAVYGIGGLVMSLIIEGLDRNTPLDYKISWVVGAAYAFTNNFLGLKYIVFRRTEK